MDLGTIAVIWLVLCGLVAWVATTKGKNGVTWFILAVVISPLLAGLFALVMNPTPRPPSTPVGLTGSVADELAKLVALRNAGELTQAEFDQQRARLIGSSTPSIQVPGWQRPVAPSSTVDSTGFAAVAPSALEPKTVSGSRTAERVVIVLIVLAVIGGGVLLVLKMQADQILADVSSFLPTTTSRPATPRPATPVPADNLAAAIGDPVDLVDGDQNDLGTVTVIKSGKPSELLGSGPTAGYRYIAAQVNYVARASWTYNLFDWAAHDVRQFQYEPLGYAPNSAVELRHPVRWTPGRGMGRVRGPGICPGGLARLQVGRHRHLLRPDRLVARRADPELIHQARRVAVRNRLTGSGMDLDVAERWCDAWEAEAALQGISPGRDYWDAGRLWIDAQCEGSLSSGQDRVHAARTLTARLTATR